MNPFLIPVALVIGAFLLGRGRSKAAPVRRKALPPPPTELPQPGVVQPHAPPPTGPLPPGPEGATPPDPEEMEALWGMVNYGVEFYPADDGTVAPPGEHGISSNAGCTSIAVGDGWWDVAGTYAGQSLSEDPKVIYNDIVGTYLPLCAKVDTQGAGLFRAELMDRINQMFTPAAQDMGMSRQIVVMEEGGQLRHHGGNSIVLEPRKVYHPSLGQTSTTWDWRVWGPGPVTVGTNFQSGTHIDFNTALWQAQNASVTGPAEVMNPRRNGGRAGRARMARKAPRRRLHTLRAR